MGDGIRRGCDPGIPGCSRACSVVSVGHVIGGLGRNMARAIQQTRPTLEHDPWPGIVCGGGIGVRRVSPFRAWQFDRERPDDVTGSGLFERTDRDRHVRDSIGMAGDVDTVHLGTPARAGNARRADHSDPHTRKAVKNDKERACENQFRVRQNVKKHGTIPDSEQVREMRQAEKQLFSRQNKPRKTE